VYLQRIQNQRSAGLRYLKELTGFGRLFDFLTRKLKPMVIYNDLSIWFFYNHDTMYLRAGYFFLITVIVNSDTRNDTQWGLGAVLNNRPTLVYISATLLCNLLQICSPSPHTSISISKEFLSRQRHCTFLHAKYCKALLVDRLFSKYFFSLFLQTFYCK
jgi:hypothetical protein